MNIIVVKDGEEITINNQKYKFIDLHASKNKLYGFETTFDNDKTLVFLGDETLLEELYDVIKDKDYVMHEAFCLDSEENIPKVVKEHHATVKSVCQTMEPFDIKNLIIYHTEDSHENKKELYTKEASMYFSRNVIIPDDLETIELCKK